MSNELSVIQHWMRYGAYALAAISAAISGYFGLHAFGLLVAAGFVIAALGSAFIWPLALHLLRSRAWGTGIAAIAFGVLFTGTDVISNFGAVSATRSIETQTADVQNTRYDDARQTIQDSEALQALLSNQLTALQAEKPWLATVTADGMRADLDVIDEAIRQEANRGGCGPKCLALRQDRAEIVDRIGAVEQFSDLQSRITATKRALATARAEAAPVERATSVAQQQSQTFASIATFSLTPSDDAMHWADKGIGFMAALFFTFGAMGLAIMGYWQPAGGSSAAPTSWRETLSKIDATPPRPPVVESVTPRPTSTSPPRFTQTTVGELAQRKLRRMLDEAHGAVA